MKNNYFDIPAFHYFEEGNTYSGSKTSLASQKVYNFKYINESDQLRVLIWYGPYDCLHSKIQEEKQFSITEEGYHQSVEWIVQQYEWFRDKVD